MKKIFIDGSAGTVGLRLGERLCLRSDLEILKPQAGMHMDKEERRRLLNEADVAFLCLPDDAAIEAVSMVENENTVIIDASTAHRTAPGWVYGFPELTAEQSELIRSAKRIAVPGCHACGFISLIKPLVNAGVIPKELPMRCFSLTGYSGGGNKMIAEYDMASSSSPLVAPRQYGIAQKHKHLPEMQSLCSLAQPPIFMPVVAPYYQGMQVSVPIFASEINGSAAQIKEVYSSLYTKSMVVYDASLSEQDFISAKAMAGSDSMRVGVCGNDERIVLISLFDNLGKGAAGAAIECMNIVLGFSPEKGLRF